MSTSGPAPTTWPAQRRDGYRTARSLGRALVLLVMVAAMFAFCVAIGGAAGAWLGLATYIAVPVVLVARLTRRPHATDPEGPTP